MLYMSRVAAPLGLGQGLTRLLQFSGQLASENENLNVSSLPRLLSTFPLTLISLLEASIIILERASSRIFYAKGDHEGHFVEG